MQRSPLGGRGFESFSEDPVLAGQMTAATINGIQSTGVAATPKHFVCNDQEDQRMAVDSIVTERALREIYLMPFQIAQLNSDPWCYMTAYNKVNGTHASESPRLIRDVLRKEWGFAGMIMSDWFGTYSTTESVKAGLDLEMPGPSYIRGQHLVTQALGCGKLSHYDIDNCVREILRLIKRVLPLGIPEHAPEHNVDTKETAALLREISANSLVLMKNENNVLPFKKEKTIAVIGPNANSAAYCGGGSAALRPYYAISPLDGIKKQSSNAKYALGSPGWKNLPVASRLTKTSDGKPGLTMHVYLDPPTKKDRKPIEEVYVDDSKVFLGDYKNPSIPTDLFYPTFTGTFTPIETTTYQFSISVAGTAKLYVDSTLVVDNATHQTPGDSFFGSGTREEIGTINLEANKTYKIHVDFGTLPTITFRSPGATTFGPGGIRIGLERQIDTQTELDRAVTIAKSVDQVLLVAGLNSDWESEGYDRTHMSLPAGNDALISAVCAANPNTAVVIQSGTPVAMPWIDSAPALIQAWYGGNETGNAIADVIFGTTNPSGKLPLSFPIRNEDNPAFLNYKSERNRTLYGEDVYVGYRFYEKTKRPVLFPFGHGLSYTSFSLSDVSVSSTSNDFDTATITVSLSVANTGSVSGSEVIQIYITPSNPSINRPVKELKGFAKVHLKAGETRKDVKVQMSLKYATSFWDEERDSWVCEKDVYAVLVGTSSEEGKVRRAGEVKVERTRWWRGL